MDKKKVESGNDGSIAFSKQNSRIERNFQNDSRKRTSQGAEARFCVRPVIRLSYTDLNALEVRLNRLRRGDVPL